MGELAWWIYPIESIAIGAAVFIGGHNLTCYYPFLLSHKVYITVKNPKLQKILVSDQFNRNKSSQTKHEDRNKMAVLGFIHYVIQFLLLSAIYTLVEWKERLLPVVSMAPPDRGAFLMDVLCRGNYRLM